MKVQEVYNNSFNELVLIARFYKENMSENIFVLLWEISDVGLNVMIVPIIIEPRESEYVDSNKSIFKGFLKAVCFLQVSLSLCNSSRRKKLAFVLLCFE